MSDQPELPAEGLVPRFAPEHLRGRVMSMFQQTQVAMTTGGVVAGLLAAKMGSGPAVVLMGLLCACAIAALGIAAPSIRTIRL